MKMITKLISVVLCTSLLFSVTIEAFASTGETNQQNQTSDNRNSFDNVQGEEVVETPIVQEITEGRTEFSKEFLLEDGAKMIAVYNQPVHFQNDKNEWVDYDSSLVAQGSREFTNKTGNINVNLSKEASEKDMIQLSSDSYSISWGYDGVNKSQMQAINRENIPTGNDEYTNLTDVTSEALYADIFKNIDLQYFVSSTGVKENIILKNADVQSEFNITYTTNNLTAKQVDDYTVSLVNKNGEEVYQLLAPYMTDAKGETSTQLKISILSQENGSINLKLVADSEFIQSSDRTFPITIDPEVTRKFQKNFTLDEGEGDIRLKHGPYYVSNNHYVLTMVKSLPELEEGEQIISAKFSYDITNSDTLFASEDESAVIFNARKINALNGNVVVRGSTVLDYDSITYNDNKQITFDLTKLVKDWYAGTEPANGFVFEANDTVGNKQVNIRDRNSTDLNPSFTIIYKDFKGTESGMSYHTFDAGQKATASVSDYLGNLVVCQTLYEGTGARMPVSISTTYNSIGNTWGFSFNQKITAASNELSALGYDYIYTDSDGTNHYLKKSENSNEWCDEDGLGITMTKPEDNLTIENGTTQTYELPSAGGKLLSEKDEHNNTITYTYSNGVISSITDGAGRVITINSANGVVTSIQLPDGNSVNFTYSDGCITKVAFPDNRMSRYSYDNGKLVLIEQADRLTGSENVNSKLGFTYTGDKVIKVTQYGSDGTEGNYLNLAYGTDNTTVFTDKQGRQVTYTFDNSGNRISVLNANGYLESSAAEGLFVTGGADSFTKNYITDSTEHTGSYLTKYNGKRDRFTSSGGSVSLDETEKYFGSNSVKITNPTNVQNTAFFTGATHAFNAAQFTGKDVTFSAYVKTSAVEQIYTDGTIGASLSITCLDPNGYVVSENSSIGITGTEDWQRLSVSANISPIVASFKINCDLRYASGIAWFDCLQLEEGNCANDFNALQNADFSSSDHWLTEENNAITPQNGTVTITGEAAAYDDIQEEEAVEESTVEETEPSTY